MTESSSPCIWGSGALISWLSSTEPGGFAESVCHQWRWQSKAPSPHSTCSGHCVPPCPLGSTGCGGERASGCSPVGAERWLVPKGRGNGSGGMPGAAAMSWEGDGIGLVFPSLDSAPLALPPLKVIPLGPELGHPKVEHQCLQSKEWAIMQSLATVAKPGTRCCDECLWAVPWAERPLLAGCGGCSAPCGVGGTLGGCAMQPGRSWLCTWGCQETVSGMFPVCELVAVFVACDLCHAEFGWKLGFG